MEQKTEKKKLAEMETYVFMDVSNIRAACLKTCGFRVDFIRFAQYLRKKYPNLKALNYYEGMAKGDERKAKVLEELERGGYSVKTLERKSYNKSAIKREYICEKCGHKNIVVVAPKYKVLKSNVDVYLATEMLETAFRADGSTHIIIVSCDGDYAEAIRAILRGSDAFVMVLATPPAKVISKNTLSVRLRDIGKDYPTRYALNSIESIKKRITKNEDGSEDTSSRVGNTSPVT